MNGFLNAVDISVAVVLVIGLADGARRGLSGEVAVLVSTVLSGLAAWKFSGFAQAFVLKNSALSAKEATVLGVIAVFVAAYVVLWIVRKSAAAMMQFNFKGKAERLGGALSGLLRYSVFAVALLLLASFIPNEKVQKAVAEDSVSGNFVFERVRPLYEELSREHGIPLPVEGGELGRPPRGDAPVIRDVEVPAGGSAPVDVITNEAPEELPLGPVK